MHLQYKILKRDYNINPNFILMYIEQQIFQIIIEYDGTQHYTKNLFFPIAIDTISIDVFNNIGKKFLKTLTLWNI